MRPCLIPTSGTTGRSKLVTQTQRAYAMAAEGFPWWMELGPDDRLMTSLPLFHINAPAYSMLGSIAAGASFALLPRFSASGFIDSARRHGATEFNAIGAMLEILMRQPPRPDDADNPLRLCYTGPARPRSASSRSRPALASDRVRLRHVGDAVRHDLGARHSPVRHPREHPPAPAAGVSTRAAVVDGELQLRNPAVMCAATGACPKRPPRCSPATAGFAPATWSSANADGTYTSSAGARR